MGAEDSAGLCRGAFSSRLDEVFALASYLCATERLKLQSVENVAKAQEIMKIELIAQRTEVVNRLVRYPFIVLLIMLARVNQQVFQGLDRGSASEADVKLTRQVIEDIETVGQGAFVPIWQQPVVELSFYGLLALLQYLYRANLLSDRDRTCA